MKIQKLLTIGALSSLAVFTSCEDDNDPSSQDTKAPVFQTLTLNGEDEELDATAGGDLVVAGSVTDNMKLGEFKLDIHDDFDGHDHGKTAADWTHVMILPLSGKSAQILETISIPSDATAGPYHAIARLIDDEGNEAEFMEFELMISNGSEPVVNLVNPDPTMETDWEPGMTYALEGTITDDAGIDEVIIILEEEGDHDHGKVAEEPIFEGDYDLGGVTSWDMMSDGAVQIAIPSDAEHADYELTIAVVDVDGNWAIAHADIHVH